MEQPEDEPKVRLPGKAFCRKCGGRCTRIVDYRWYCERCGSQPYPAAMGQTHDR